MIALQNIIFPEPPICSEDGLYFRLNTSTAFDPADPGLHLRPGGTACFNTYFNALNIGKWHKECHLDGLYLSLSGAGTFKLTVWQVDIDTAEKVIFQDTITLEPSTEFQADLSQYQRTAPSSLIYFDLKALTNARFLGAKFLTGTVVKALPSLAISITTFRREAEIKATAKRLEKYLQRFEFRDHVAVFVVDNGQSAKIATSKKITCLQNRNLGGAGGFARGLLEAEKAGFSHCLFMDDDATFHLENIHRTYVFLALNRAPCAAVAGAMISNTYKWRLWENGAVFNRSCRPMSGGTDLREFDELLEMEGKSTEEKPHNFYGGWWFFAFPIAHVTHYPFPFFVRGDDINFSLANNFRISTLSGVVSFQDDFSEKESPQTLYLDLRNHLVQHLTIDALNIGAFRCARIALWFILRNAVKFQYETCDVLLLSWRDVMRGPGFFTENADMAPRRQSIKDMIDVETWKPVAELDLHERRRFNPNRKLWLPIRALLRLSQNGHFLPFYSLWANHVVVPPEERGLFKQVWGSSRLTYLNRDRRMGYTVRQSKLRFAGLMWQTLVTGLRFVAGYQKLRRAYKAQYPAMTSKPYWTRLLDITPKK